MYWICTTVSHLKVLILVTLIRTPTLEEKDKGPACNPTMLSEASPGEPDSTSWNVSSDHSQERTRAGSTGVQIQAVASQKQSLT